MIITDVSLIGPWVAERTGGTWSPGRGTAIGELDEVGALQAGVLYEDYNVANVVCHIAGDGAWASRHFLWVIFDYPFNHVGVKRITVPVASSNSKSIRLVEKMGFTLECSLTQATPDGDLLLFRMFKNECKYLTDKYTRG